MATWSIEGLADLAAGRTSAASLLVSLAAPRLRREGVPVTNPQPDPELRLYRLLSSAAGDLGYARYNAHLRLDRVVRRRVFCRQDASGRPGGGRVARCGSASRANACSVSCGALPSRHPAAGIFGSSWWAVGPQSSGDGGSPRSTWTLHAADEAVFLDIQRIKETQRINVEFARPEHFVPPLGGAANRHLFIATFGGVSFFHYDPYSQVLSKVVRGFRRDLQDARRFIDTGLVDAVRFRTLVDAIPDSAFTKYPALSPQAIRDAVSAFLDSSSWSVQKPRNTVAQHSQFRAPSNQER